MPAKRQVNNLPISAVSDTSGLLGEPLIVAKDYLSLTELILQSDFQLIEQQLILFILSQEIKCDYCMLVHKDEIEVELMSDQIQAMRQEEKSFQNVRFFALHEFLQQLIVYKDLISTEAIQTFLNAGFTQKNAMELSMALSMKAISNYTKHISKTSTISPEA